MEIILKEDVINLGFKDDIVNVKPGYGRNFLIPMGKAVIASESNKKILAENLRQRAHKLAAIKTSAEEVAKSLEGVALTIEAKAKKSGALYGSVNAVQIAEELAKLGKDIDKKLIAIKHGIIKEVGTFDVEVRLHREVTAVISVCVKATGSDEESTEA